VESTLLSTLAELPELFRPPNTPDTSAVIAETSSARKKERKTHFSDPIIYHTHGSTVHFTFKQQSELIWRHNKRHGYN